MSIYLYYEQAVHFELTHSMTASDFLLAIRRFVAYHSLPSLIISDNGRNFVGFNNFLKEIMEEPEVKSYLEGNGVNWKFITPRALWPGGFYERLVGVLKGCLFKALYHKRVSFEELRTLLVKFRAVINSQPLTYLSSDLDCKALTPSMLLYGRNVCISPPLNNSATDDPDFMGSRDLRAQYFRLSSVLRKFENSWKRDYLVSLRERHNNSSNNLSANVKVGDIVMVDLEDHLGKGYRSLLSLGRVTQRFPSSDGVITSVEVRVNDILYMISITKLVLLELPEMDFDSVLTPEPDSVPLNGARPRRAAAIRCDQERKDLISVYVL
ncbi:uncharacterized protein [Palaemon carinicauda]|uniref:uncharacterized protein n=1 Tax=Palaemon carinicauda TaxID=392227 RepID=UPI0035B65555